MKTISNGLRGHMRHGFAGLALLALLVGCSGGNGRTDDGETPRPEASKSAEPNESTLYELAASELSASLEGAYKIKRDGSRVPPAAKELPVALGTVEAHWYRSKGVFVAAFGGLDLEAAGPVCPGSSIQTDSGFEHVSNSPTEEGACEGAKNVAGSDAGVRTCGPLVLYITEIPEATDGDLFASVERYVGNGQIIGVTGIVAADNSAAPEIDLGAAEYSLPDGLVKGTSEVTC